MDERLAQELEKARKHGEEAYKRGDLYQNKYWQGFRDAIQFAAAESSREAAAFVWPYHGFWKREDGKCEWCGNPETHESHIPPGQQERHLPVPGPVSESSIHHGPFPSRAGQQEPPANIIERAFKLADDIFEAFGSKHGPSRSGIAEAIAAELGAGQQEQPRETQPLPTVEQVRVIVYDALKNQFPHKDAAMMVASCCAEAIHAALRRAALAATPPVTKETK